MCLHARSTRSFRVVSFRPFVSFDCFQLAPGFVVVVSSSLLVLCVVVMRILPSSSSSSSLSSCCCCCCCCLCHSAFCRRVVRQLTLFFLSFFSIPFETKATERGRWKVEERRRISIRQADASQTSRFKPVDKTMKKLRTAQRCKEQGEDEEKNNQLAVSSSSSSSYQRAR